MAKQMLRRMMAVTLSMLLMVPASGFVAFAAEGDSQDGQGDLTATEPIDGTVAEEETVQELIGNRSGLGEGTYYFQSAYSSTMRMLAYAGNSKVQIAVATGKKAQQWVITIGKDGYAHVKNAHSGKVLTVSGGVAVSDADVVQSTEKAAGDSNAPGSAQQFENLDQKWVVKKVDDRYAFISALDEKLSLTIANKSASPAFKASLKEYQASSRQLFSCVALSKVKQTIPSRSNIAKGTYYIQPSSTSACVLGARGANVRLATTAGTSDQRWKLTVGRDGYAKLTNVNAKKVLSVKGGKAAKGALVYLRAEKAPSVSNAAGTVLAQESLYQKWVVKKRGKKLMIVSALDPKYALQISGKEKNSKAELRKLSASSARQQFTFVASKPSAAKKGTRTVANGVYMLAPTSQATQVVSIAGSAKASGANAQIAAFAATVKQTFRVVYDGKGFYAITNVYSGKRLAPVAACSVPGVNVGQYNLGKKAADRGKWRIEKYGKGYRLVNKATGLALSMVNSSHPNGTNICADELAAKERSQRFSLVRPCDLSPQSSLVKGMFYITMKADRGSVVGIRDDLRTEGISANIRKWRNTNVQRFEIKSADKDTYYIQNVATQRVLSLEGQSKKAGTDVVTRWNDGKDWQKWKIVYNDDFSYAFVNAYSGKHLHVTGGRTEDNVNVVVADARTSSPAQQFLLSGTAKNTGEQVEINVPCYLQNPELPTGCESVALTNAIRYWGFGLSKTEIADRWMPYGSDGVWNFIGNPRNSSGWIICAPGIANTANSYFRSKGSNVHASVVKGRSLASLREYLDRGEPVVVWTTIGMGSPGTVQWWNSGYPLRSNNHAVVLCGYNPRDGYYRVADSLAGTVWREGSRFEWLYNEMGRQAVDLWR